MLTIPKPSVWSMENIINTFPRSIVWEDVKDVRSRSGVTQSGAELLWSGRELTTKWGNNFGLSSCAVPQSAVAHVVVYFRRTELLSGVQERSGI